MSGMMLGKTMGRARRPRRALHRRVRPARRPRGALADGRALADVDDQHGVLDPARDRLLGRGPELRHGPAISRHASSRSRRCRRGCCSRSRSCSRSAPTSRRRWRCSTASSSTSTCRSTSSRPRPGRAAPGELLGEVRFEGVGFRYDERSPGRCTTSTSSSRRARARRSSARPAPARRRSATSSPASTSRRGAGHDRRRRRARRELRVARRDGRRRLPGDLPVPRHGAREPALRAARGDRRGDRGGGAHGADPRR